MASRRTVPKAPDPINDAHQALEIFRAFAAYLSEVPGRGIVLSREGKKFRVTLEDARHTKGTTLADAGAQAAMVIVFDATGA